VSYLVMVFLYWKWAAAGFLIFVVMNILELYSTIQKERKDVAENREYAKWKIEEISSSKVEVLEGRDSDMLDYSSMKKIENKKE